MQDKELSQEIEEFIKIQYMQEEPEAQNHDVDLMPSTQQVTI